MARKNPHDELTDEQIAELMAEAIEVGDVEMIEVCELAIDGDGEAIMVCIQAISVGGYESNPAKKKAAKKKASKKKASKKKASKKKSKKKASKKRGKKATTPNRYINETSAKSSSKGVQFDSLSPSEKRIALAYKVDRGTQPYLVPEGSLAPFVAVHWHGGQDSALYALSSTGILDKETLNRALKEFNDAYGSALKRFPSEDDDEYDEEVDEEEGGPESIRTAIDELEEMQGNLSKHKIVGFPGAKSNPGAADTSSRAKRMMNPQNY